MYACSFFSHSPKHVHEGTHPALWRLVNVVRMPSLWSLFSGLFGDTCAPTSFSLFSTNNSIRRCCRISIYEVYIIYSGVYTVIYTLEYHTYACIKYSCVYMCTSMDFVYICSLCVYLHLTANDFSCRATTLYLPAV